MQEESEYFPPRKIIQVKGAEKTQYDRRESLALDGRGQEAGI